MSIGLVFEAPTLTEAQYDQVAKEVFPGNKMPTGMLYHVAGSSPTGWRVIEVWNSQASADLFLKEKLGAALQRANITVQPQAFDVHNIATA
jgi:quinol monooxygenase YgiN